MVPVLFTFYIQGVLKLKKNNSGAKKLKKKVKFTLNQLRHVSVLKLHHHHQGAHSFVLTKVTVVRIAH